MTATLTTINVTNTELLNVSNEETTQLLQQLHMDYTQWVFQYYLTNPRHAETFRMFSNSRKVMEYTDK